MTFNPWVIVGIIVALVLSAGSGGLIGWHERSVRVPAELNQQKDTDTKSCEQIQHKTQEANDALQKNRDTIARKLASLKLQHTSACVHPASSPNLPGSGPEHAGQNGASISTDWLRDYAAEAEQYRSNFNVCTQFIASERASPAQ